MRSIYVATIENGRGINKITRFDGRNELLLYAIQITAMRDTRILRRDSIDVILDKLADLGPGYGARWHRRVTLKEMRGFRLVGFRLVAW